MEAFQFETAKMLAHCNEATRKRNGGHGAQRSWYNLVGNDCNHQLVGCFFSPGCYWLATLVEKNKSSWIIAPNKNIAGWRSTPTLLLICSSFSRENGHSLLICSSLSTARIGVNFNESLKSLPRPVVSCLQLELMVQTFSSNLSHKVGTEIILGSCCG